MMTLRKSGRGLFISLVSVVILAALCPHPSEAQDAAASFELHLATCVLESSGAVTVTADATYAVACPHLGLDTDANATMKAARTSLNPSSTALPTSMTPSPDAGCLVEFSGTLPLPDPFACVEEELELQLQPTSKGLEAGGGVTAMGSPPGPLMTTASFCAAPSCQWHPLGMAYSSLDELVAEPGHAELLLLCTHEIDEPSDCLTLRGLDRRGHHLDTGFGFSWRPAPNGQGHIASLVWDPSYRGKLTVDVQHRRDKQQCLMDLAEPLVCPSCDCSKESLMAQDDAWPEDGVDFQCLDGLKIFDRPGPVQPISFKVMDHASSGGNSIVTTSQVIAYGCSSGQCNLESRR